MFHAMMDGIKEESVGYLFNLEVQVEQQVEEVPVEDGARGHGLAGAGARRTRCPRVPPPARPAIRAKGLDAPQRPDRLHYSAPTAEGGVVEGELETGAADGRAGSAPLGRPDAGRAAQGPEGRQAAARSDPAGTAPITEAGCRGTCGRPAPAMCVLPAGRALRGRVRRGRAPGARPPCEGCAPDTGWACWRRPAELVPGSGACGAGWTRGAGWTPWSRSDALEGAAEPGTVGGQSVPAPPAGVLRPVWAGREIGFRAGSAPGARPRTGAGPRSVTGPSDGRSTRRRAPAGAVVAHRQRRRRSAGVQFDCGAAPAAVGAEFQAEGDGALAVPGGDAGEGLDDARRRAGCRAASSTAGRGRSAPRGRSGAVRGEGPESGRRPGRAVWREQSGDGPLAAEDEQQPARRTRRRLPSPARGRRRGRGGRAGRGAGWSPRWPGGRSTVCAAAAAPVTRAWRPRCRVMHGGSGGMGRRVPRSDDGPGRAAGPELLGGNWRAGGMVCSHAPRAGWPQDGRGWSPQGGSGTFTYRVIPSASAGAVRRTWRADRLAAAAAGLLERSVRRIRGGGATVCWRADRPAIHESGSDACLCPLDPARTRSEAHGAGELGPRARWSRVRGHPGAA